MKYFLDDEKTEYDEALLNAFLKEKNSYGFVAKEDDVIVIDVTELGIVMLVSAFSSVEIIMNAYKYATKNKYRFFSFGDAMFIN